MYTLIDRSDFRLLVFNVSIKAIKADKNRNTTVFLVLGMCYHGLIGHIGLYSGGCTKHIV